MSFVYHARTVAACLRCARGIGKIVRSLPKRRPAWISRAAWAKLRRDGDR